MSSSAKQSLIHKPDQDGENYVRGDLEAQRLGSFRRSSGSSSSDRRYFSFFLKVILHLLLQDFAITCFATNCKILWAKDKYFSPGSKGGVSGSSVSLTTPQVRNTSVDDHRQREVICIFPFLTGAWQLLAGSKRRAAWWPELSSAWWPGWPSPWWPGRPSPWWPGWQSSWWPQSYLQYPSSHTTAC